MKHPGILATALLVLSGGCTPNDPRDAISVDMKRAGDATGDLRYAATATQRDGVAFDWVEMAIAARADDVCGDARVAWTEGHTLFNGVADAPEAAGFICTVDAMPGMTVLRVGEAMPEQPALAAGHARRWASALTLGMSLPETVDRLLGSTLGGLYASQCAGRGLTVGRIASYRQAADPPGGELVTLWVDYRCNAEAVTAADIAAP